LLTRGKAAGSGWLVTEPTGAERLGSELVVVRSTFAVDAVENGLVKGFSPNREESLLQAADALARRAAATIFEIRLLSQDATRVRITQHPGTQHSLRH
jgi:enoyl-CoA hydratase/carnithine racemase